MSTVRRRIAAVNEPIARFTEEAARAGDRPVCITGDCCAAIGALTGLQRAGIAPTLLWLDAHGDFNTPETTPSGYLGGMPLAMLTGRGDLEILDALGARAIDDDTVVLYDARDLDPLEREALAASRVTHLTSLEALEGFDFRGAPVHVHLDPDVLNPLDAPAMAYATPGGPRLAALSRALSRLTGRGVSVSSVTVDDVGDRSRRIAEHRSGRVAVARVVAGTSDSIALRYARTLSWEDMPTRKSEAKRPARLPASVSRALDQAKIIGVRAGAPSQHRFTGVWVVVVDGRAFARSWDVRPGGWFESFREARDGAIQVGARAVRVTGRVVRGERLLDAIEAAYAAKYSTPASKAWVRGFRAPRRRRATLEFLPRSAR